MITRAHGLPGNAKQTTSKRPTRVHGLPGGGRKCKTDIDPTAYLRTVMAPTYSLPPVHFVRVSALLPTEMQRDTLHLNTREKSKQKRHCSTWALYEIWWHEVGVREKQKYFRSLLQGLRFGKWLPPSSRPFSKASVLCAKIKYAQLCSTEVVL